MSNRQFVVCIDNGDHPVSLEVRKIYEVLEDEQAERHGLLRVVDESGEDYLYPRALFTPIDVSDALSRVLDGTL